LSGKFTRTDAAAGSRIKREDVSAEQLAIAAEVDKVADELGVTSTQVSLAWLRARRGWVHPIIGARTYDQLTDNLAAADLRLPEEVVDRLDTASAFPLGFPQDFIGQAREFVYGPSISRFDRR
ncbi:MAG: aldo/keto reductase, partial [Nonomuraea sp.]|nr:aldo/keto reductase [Nonomuraea sp.]